MVNYQLRLVRQLVRPLHPQVPLRLARQLVLLRLLRLQPVLVRLLPYKEDEMKTVFNPENGAPISKFLFRKRLYELPVGEKKPFEDELANFMLQTYEFLEEFTPAGRFVCKNGDYANDTKIAVFQHEKTCKNEVATEEGKEFITPQEILDAEKRERLQMARDPLQDGGEFTDRDGVGWYGEGVAADNNIRPTNARRPGAF